MRLLLFFISSVFGVIFYSFYKAQWGINIFWNINISPLHIKTLSTNLLIEVCSFLILGIFFLFYFSLIGNDKKIELNKNIKGFYLFFYLLLITCYISKIFVINFFIIWFLSLFIFWDICFTSLSSSKYFFHQKISLRYIGIFINYIISILGLYYLFSTGFSFYIIYILLYSFIFNFYVHKKYVNYISLFMSILIWIFILYFWILQIYSISEKVLFI